MLAGLAPGENHHFRPSAREANIRPIPPGRLLAAYLLDLAWGDPESLPHPVRGMGALISLGERIAQPGQGSAMRDLLNGTAVSLFTIAAAYATGRLLCRTPLAEVALAWTTLATGSLVSEANAVLVALEECNLPLARTRLSRIVGRDTASLPAPEIARAVIETVAESLCDGIVAPLWYLAWGGVPLALAYKAVNTLDSMIGHPEAPYTYFGRFAARLDDVLNFLPARCAALVIVVAGFSTGDARSSCKTWLRDGSHHPSPNAGQTEAAMAGALQVRLGGATVYSGQVSQKPFLGPEFRQPATRDARLSLRVLRVASALACAVAVTCTWWRQRT